MRLCPRTTGAINMCVCVCACGRATRNGFLVPWACSTHFRPQPPINSYKKVSDRSLMSNKLPLIRRNYSEEDLPLPLVARKPQNEIPWIFPARKTTQACTRQFETQKNEMSKCAHTRHLSCAHTRGLWHTRHLSCARTRSLSCAETMGVPTDEFLC